MTSSFVEKLAATVTFKARSVEGGLRSVSTHGTVELKDIVSPDKKAVRIFPVKTRLCKGHIVNRARMMPMIIVKVSKRLYSQDFDVPR